MSNQAREVQSPKRSSGKHVNRGYKVDDLEHSSGDGTTGTGSPSKVHTSVLVNRTKAQTSAAYGESDSGASLYNPRKK